MSKNNKLNFIKLALIGFFTGIILSMFFEFINFDKIHFNISPIILQSLPTIALVIIYLVFSQMKKVIKLDNFSDSETSLYSKNYKKLLLTTSLSTIFIIINFMIFGINNVLFNEINNISIAVLLLFMINIILGCTMEVAHINLIAKVQPEKNADVSDLNYNQNAIETLDEYELQIAGKSALKTMGYMIYIYLIIFIIGIFTNQSTIFFICTSSIWIANQGIYTYQHIKICSK